MARLPSDVHSSDHLVIAYENVYAKPVDRNVKDYDLGQMERMDYYRKYQQEKWAHELQHVQPPVEVRQAMQEQWIEEARRLNNYVQEEREAVFQVLQNNQNVRLELPPLGRYLSDRAPTDRDSFFFDVLRSNRFG